MIPTIRHSWKDNTMESVKRSVLARGSDREGNNGQSQEEFESSETTRHNTVMRNILHYTFV